MHSQHKELNQTRDECDVWVSGHTAVKYGLFAIWLGQDFVLSLHLKANIV